MSFPSAVALGLTRLREKLGASFPTLPFFVVLRRCVYRNLQYKGFTCSHCRGIMCGEGQRTTEHEIRSVQQSYSDLMVGVLFFISSCQSLY